VQFYLPSFSQKGWVSFISWYHPGVFEKNMRGFTLCCTVFEEKLGGFYYSLIKDFEKKRGSFFLTWETAASISRKKWFVFLLWI